MKPDLSRRYLDRGPLGSGGMGEVRRVYDRVLDRDVAMKTLRWTLIERARARRRFEAEATMTAGLIHPSIVPIYDRGASADGRPWYTMKLVEGRTLADAIGDRLPLRRAIEAFARICEAMAYAHTRGVIHRDIKPANIMLGPFGEVLLMDWGIARRVVQPVDDAPSARATAAFDAAAFDAAAFDPSDRGGATAPTGAMHPQPTDDDPWTPDGDARLTGTGAALGTPGFMAPEQLDPTIGPIGPRADVYALGGTLSQIITGQPPRPSREAAMHGLLSGVPVRLDAGPEPLRAIADRALSLDPGARYPDAGALAEAIRAWLDGEARRTRARALLADAERLAPRPAELRADAARLSAEADAILGPLPPHAPVDEKAPGWDLEDAAAARLREARIADVRYLQAVQAALRTAPDLTTARDHLTGYYRRRLLEAEAERDADTAAEYAELLRTHDPEGNVEWLRGDGALTLVTDPPGARVRVCRYVLRRRRLEPVFERDLPPTPLFDHPLAMGSYALELTAPGCMPVTYPVLIERNGRWHGIRPGDDSPHAIWLPPVGAIDDDTAYVPAGWFISGDPKAPDGLPRRRVWVDAFAMRKHPVTNAEYIEWLDWLVDAGRADEALEHVPIARGGDGGASARAYERDRGGRFHVGEADGMQWRPGAPVSAVTWRSATAFAAWRSQVEGVPYRLPHSFEWEKAARAVDGRCHGWGDHFESTWAMTAQSQPGRPTIADVDAFDGDRSPYGVMGMTGNVRELCHDAYHREGPVIEDGVLRAMADLGPSMYCMVKGGAFSSGAATTSAAARFGWPLDHAAPVVGFRLLRGPLRR